MLGYGKYSAKICWVGGYANLVEETDVISASWNRELSNISDGRVTIAKGDCCDLLKYATSVPWLELHIIRNAICGDDRVSDIVWSGRIRRISTDNLGNFEIVGVDFASWLDDRILDVFDYVNVDTNVASSRIIEATLVKNNSMGIIVQFEDSGVEASDSIDEGNVISVLSQVNEFVRGSSYWTQHGRYFRLGLECGTLQLSDKDFVDLPDISFDSSEYANSVWVGADRGSGEDSKDIRYNVSNSGVWDGYEILVEKMLSSTVADAANANQLAQKFLEANGQVGVIVDVNKSFLRPDSELKINTLIPGCKVSANFNTVCGLAGSDGFLRAVNMSYNGIDEQISLEVGPSVVEESSRKILAG